MEQQENWETGARSAGERPLAQIHDVEALKSRYRCFGSAILQKWSGVITGAHREAIKAVLAERAVRAGAAGSAEKRDCPEEQQ